MLTVWARIIGVVVVVASAMWARASDRPPSPEQLLETIRDLDSVCFSGTTVRGTELTDQWREIGSHKIPATFELSLLPRVICIRRLATEIPPLPPPERPDAAGGGRTQFLREYALFDAAGSAQLLTYVSEAKVGAAPETIKEDQLTWILEYYIPHDPSLDMSRDRLLWCMGRGFGSAITKIESIRVEEDSRLRCVAIGLGVGQIDGTWELLIDPNAGYLVRNAKFRRDGHKEIETEISTTGIRKSHDRWIAESGMWTDTYGSAPPTTMPATFESVEASSDQALIDDIQRRMRGPFVGSTLVRDARQPNGFSKQMRRGNTYIPGGTVHPSTRPSTQETR